MRTMLSRRGILRLAAAGSGSVFLGGLVGVGAAAATFESRYSRRFYPGVSVGGIDLSGLSWSDAVARLNDRWRPLISMPVVIRSDSGEWRPTGSQIGLLVDYLTPLRSAYAWGRSGGVAMRASQQIDGLRSSRDWPVITSFDREKYVAYVDEILPGLHRRATEATVAIVGEQGSRSFVVSPSTSGQSILGADKLVAFQPKFDPPGTQAFELQTHAVPPNSTTDELLELVQNAERMTSGQLSVRRGERTWTIDRAWLRDRMKLEQSVEGARLVFPIEAVDFKPFVEGIATELNLEPIEPKVKFDVQSERFQHLTPAVDGLRVDVGELQARIRGALLGAESSVSVPMQAVRPVLATATTATLGLDSTFGIGQSLFRGSAANRIHNIRVGSGKLDGVVIEPGETFDFNKSLGPIDYDAGFVDGLIIINNRTIPGVGGGICQVSTTMFRAAFLAGLPVTERWQHVYRVSYYELGENAPPGFDASIYQPDLNFGFVNDTDDYLMIRTDFDPVAQRLRFVLNGRGPRRQVAVSSWRGAAIPPPPPRIVANTDLEPGEKRQTDYAIWGMRAGIGRKVWANSRLVLQDEFASSFQPWSARWEVGPDSLGNLDTSDIDGAEAAETTSD